MFRLQTTGYGIPPLRGVAFTCRTWELNPPLDYKSQITKINSIKEMDVVFVASWGPDVAHYLKQAFELGSNVQVLAYETFYTPKVLEVAGNSANGVIFCAPEFDGKSDSEKISRLRNKLSQKYGHTELNYHIAGHYDAMMLLLSAISNGNKSGPSIKNYIQQQETYSGLTGKVTFDKNGGASIPLTLYTVKDGGFMRYKK